MKEPQLLLKTLLTGFILLVLCLPASAAIKLYDADATTFSVDGFFNTFYVTSDQDVADKQQSRVKMGFLPNYIGFNFSKQVGDLKLGGRSSFWVTINDNSPTDTPIDIRQFYATVDGNFGQVLFGKDFGLFNRSNILKDEILMGFGKTAGIDATGVSFGNIGSGYTYPTPEAQITYRTPDLSGFKLAIGLLDPSRNAAAGEEKLPRFEGEATYDKTLGQVALSTWVGFVSQQSKNTAGDADSQGVSYGINAKFAGASLTGSGFTGEGLSALGAFAGGGNANVDSDGFLIQGSYTIDKVRLAGSYGKTKVDSLLNQEDETIIGAVFYSLNSNLTLEAEYNIEKFTDGTGAAEEKINTIALGAVLSF